MTGHKLTINHYGYFSGISPAYPREKQRASAFSASPCGVWWPLLDLNQRPSDYESPALTTELRGRGGEL